MKILITGSNGFIGKHFLKFYDDHECLAHTRHDDLANMLQHFAPERIINCAGQIYDHTDMWMPNVEYTRICLEYVMEKDISMLQIGSSAEYGIMDRASAETDRINPVNMYQATKGMSTLLCQGYARQYGLDVKIARPYSVYGPGEKPHRLFPRLYNAYMHQQPMTLYQGYHDFIYIDDFIRGCDQVINSNIDRFGDIVNLGSGQQYSNFEISELFAEITGNTAPITLHTELNKKFESEVWVCDTDYARSDYGFSIQHGIHSGITKFCNIGLDHA
jgi:nucleoside-diphosphate-sugar epimerase